MSTPVSVDPSPLAHLRTDSEQERDLQAKIQRMITLQYVEQHHSSREEEGLGLEEDMGLGGQGGTGDDPRGTILGMPKRSTTEWMNLNVMGSSTLLEPKKKGTTPWPTDSNTYIEAGLPPPSPQAGVGRGNLVFPSNFDHHRRIGSVDDAPGITMPLNNPLLQAPPSAAGGAAQTQSSPFPPRQIYAGYGALGDPASNPNELSMTAGGDLQEHEFHYGNPDFHNPYEDDTNKSNRYRPENSICAKFCCLYVPLVNLLLRESVHRSFCYGAIDGMLTGSGITAAFRALQVLTIHTRWEVRLAVVIFTTAACFADAICMAMGHVWTSYVVSSGHFQERNRERKSLDVDKGNAKARLVEMLLARGMLKIDAMSLADTLEGYPDMFVSVLVGDSLLAGGDFAEEETDDGQQQHNMLPLGGKSLEGSMGGGFDSWKFPSYGQFNEVDHEPETSNVNTILKESQVEGIFMMIGFALFAILPSLLWLLLPCLFVSEPTQAGTLVATHAKVTTGLTTTTTASQGGGGEVISLSSLVVSISGIVMWLLGVWKSRFMNSNWIMSGVENVVVLLACVMAAYGMGYGLCYAIGGKEGITLSNIVY